MKFLTINVHGWQEENQLDKIKYLAKVIHEKQYDAIAMQEVSQHRDASIVYDAIRDDNFGLLLNQELAALGSQDYELFWDISHYGFEVYEEGLALLVKHPNETFESFYVTDTTSIENWKSRRIIGGTWQINGQSLSLYTCHLGWWDDEAESYPRKVDRLINRAEASGQPFILLGDFNAPDMARNEGYDYLLSKGLYDTHQLARNKSGDHTIVGDIAGWDGNKSNLKVDYIFTSWQADITESHIIFDDQNKSIISDHYGVEIELNKQEEE